MVIGCLSYVEAPEIWERRCEVYQVVDGLPVKVLRERLQVGAVQACC